MNLHDIVDQVVINTKGSPSGSFWAVTADSSLRAFLPELVLCATVLLLLLVRLFTWGRKVPSFAIALLGSLAALYFAAPWLLTGDLARTPRMEIFTGMLVYDTFSIYMRAALLLFAVLFTVFTWISGIPNHDDAADVFTLVLGATLGMCLMTSANHLLMVFMAVEMASVPSYVLAGLVKGRRKASEAALKYAIYGAGAAGVMLYGISLIAGIANTAHLPTLAIQLAERFPSLTGGELMVLALGGLLITVGLAFKLSAVPFHFWCPDVFEGATAEIDAFLSVASKAAALALLVRVALGFGMIAPQGVEPGSITASKAAPQEVAQIAVKPNGVVYTALAEPGAPAEPAVAAAQPSTAALEPVRQFIAKLIALLAVITCTFGNLAAYGQSNIKRLLAYSTIAHAGYMMMPVSAAVALVGVNELGAARAIASLGIYVAVYLFMNLAAFAVVAFLRNAMRSEQISDYAGLIRRSPGTVVCFALVLFSLVGMPPLSGFIGKFAIFAAVTEAYQQSRAQGLPAGWLLVLLVVGGVNTAISLFYYLRVVKVMTMDEEPRERPPFAFSDVSLAGAYLWLITVPTVGLIFSWDWLSDLAVAAARQLF